MKVLQNIKKNMLRVDQWFSRHFGWFFTNGYKAEARRGHF